MKRLSLRQIGEAEFSEIRIDPSGFFPMNKDPFATIKDYPNVVKISIRQLGWFLPDEARFEAWEALQEIVTLRSMVAYQKAELERLKS